MASEGNKSTCKTPERSCKYCFEQDCRCKPITLEQPLPTKEKVSPFKVKEPWK